MGSLPVFDLLHKIELKSLGRPLKTVAFFPWKVQDLATLWQGGYNEHKYVNSWTALVDRWGNSFAVGSEGYVYILSATSPTSRPLGIKLPAMNVDDGAKPDVLQIAWALHPTQPMQGPLLLISTHRVLIVFNVDSQTIVGRLRGHGGAITSIVVHPVSPHIFCTTSRDYTTRMYDLAQTPIQEPNNVHWPPDIHPSRAGAAFGLHACEPEGDGIGRCVAVLVGGRSGGHKAAVLGAAFHPVLPLLATCGADRLVKIWHVRPKNKDVLTRVDKPLFSSSRIHQASVHSITWLKQDMLLSYCAPPIFRDVNNQTNPLSTGRGTLVVWQWLGMDRFFPPGQPEQEALRGCASDYQESSSFKFVAEYAFPQQETHLAVPRLHCYCAPSEPWVLYTYPGSQVIQVIKPAGMKPRAPPPFPWDVPEERRSANFAAGPDGWERNLSVEPLVNLEVRQLSVQVSDQGNSAVDGSLESCAMGLGGDVIVGLGFAGSEGAVWIWRRRSVGAAG